MEGFIQGGALGAVLVTWLPGYKVQSSRNLVPAHPPIITHEMQALAATVANVNRLMPDAGLVAAVLLAVVQSETLALHNESRMENALTNCTDP